MYICHLIKYYTIYSGTLGENKADYRELIDAALLAIAQNNYKDAYKHFENAYNIGWNVNFDSTVESKETFDSIFIEKLTLYCENPLNSDLNGVCRETEIDGKKYVKGFGEIRIIDLKKKIRYAAPNVIIDDILNGKYIPPIEFVDAVLTGPTFDSEEYQEFYLNYSEKNFWGENEENFRHNNTVELRFRNDFSFRN